MDLGGHLNQWVLLERWVYKERHPRWLMLMYIMWYVGDTFSCVRIEGVCVCGTGVVRYYGNLR